MHRAFPDQPIRYSLSFICLSIVKWGSYFKAMLTIHTDNGLHTLVNSTNDDRIFSSAPVSTTAIENPHCQMSLSKNMSKDNCERGENDTPRRRREKHIENPNPAIGYTKVPIEQERDFLAVFFFFEKKYIFRYAARLPFHSDGKYKRSKSLERHAAVVSTSS